MYLISNPNVLKIKEFIESNPNGVKKFRYFNKRKFEVIKNHLKTLLLVDNDIVVGYSHLDKEGENIWFGMMISDNFTGKGYGSFLIKETLSNFYEDIKLTVDKDNLSAISLYKKNNFKILKEYKNYLLMINKQS